MRTESFEQEIGLFSPLLETEVADLTSMSVGDLGLSRMDEELGSFFGGDAMELASRRWLEADEMTVPALLGTRPSETLVAMSPLRRLEPRVPLRGPEVVLVGGDGPGVTAEGADEVLVRPALADTTAATAAAMAAFLASKERPSEDKKNSLSDNKYNIQ